MKIKGELDGLISWNGYYYGYKRMKRKNKYYKSKNVRFDDTCGGTVECSEEEYYEAACKYAEIFK